MAIVAVDALLRPPMVNTTGAVGLDGAFAGTVKFIWKTPATNPGAAPR
jgi:hypothetical protein